MSYDIDNLNDFDASVIALIGFSLASKINGKLVKFGFATIRGDKEAIEASGIDGYNDFMSDMEAINATIENFDKAGQPNGERINPREQLARWINARNTLIEVIHNKGVEMTVGPVTENFSYIVRNAGSEYIPTEQQMNILIETSGFTRAQIDEANAKKKVRAIARAKEDSLMAMRVIAETGPDNTTPDGFSEVLVDSIAAGKKSALNNPRTTFEEKAADMILLKAVEDHA